VNHYIHFEWLRYILRVSEKSKDQCTLVSGKIGYGRFDSCPPHRKSSISWGKGHGLGFVVDKAHEQEIDAEELFFSNLPQILEQ
jgi:hypothetical protein